MIKRKLLLIGCLLCLFSCTKVDIELPMDSDWVFYQDEVIEEFYPKPDCVYQMQVHEDTIFVKSMFSKRCDIVDATGMVIDTIPFDTIPFKDNLRIIDSTKKYVWDTWEYNIDFSKKTRVTELQYTTTPIESLKLLKRKRPKREHRIEYVLDGKKYSMTLPTTRSSSIVYNVCQYDETHFLFSVYLKIEDIKHNGSRFYVIMMDLEELTRKQFLGIKL